VIQKDLEISHGKAIEELVGHFFSSAHLLATQPAPFEGKLLDFAQNFIGQKKHIVRQALLSSKISYSPQKLLPDREKLDIIQTYMTDTMGVMSRTIHLEDFVNSAFAKKALSEIAS
jgi:hypothetical protein